MDLNSIEEGLKVKITKLGDTKGMNINPRHLEVRKVGVIGTILGYVPGHGGHVLWVKHENGEIGAYVFNEFEKA